MHYDYVPMPRRKPLKWPNGARLAMIMTTNRLCGAPHNKFNAQFIVMQSPLVRGPDFALLLGLFSPHNGAGFKRGDQLICGLEAT